MAQTGRHNLSRARLLSLKVFMMKVFDKWMRILPIHHQQSSCCPMYLSFPLSLSSIQGVQCYDWVQKPFVPSHFHHRESRAVLFGVQCWMTEGWVNVGQSRCHGGNWNVDVEDIEKLCLSHNYCSIYKWQAIKYIWDQLSVSYWSPMDLWQVHPAPPSSTIPSAPKSIPISVTSPTPLRSSLSPLFHCLSLYSLFHWYPFPCHYDPLVSRISFLPPHSCLPLFHTSTFCS